MLLRLRDSAECGIMPRITKYANGEDASVKGAFSLNTRLEIKVECPRKLGESAVVLRIAKDGEQARDLALEYVTTENGIDTYRTELVLDSELCGDDNGLFYYEFL